MVWAVEGETTIKLTAERQNMSDHDYCPSYNL